MGRKLTDAQIDHEIVHHMAILDAVEDLIGPNIRLFHLSVWPKKTVARTP